MNNKFTKRALTLAALLALNYGIVKAQTADTTKVEQKATTTEQKEDNFKGNIEYIQTLEKDGGSYVRPNIFYSLPGKINGYNWTEVYPDGSIYGRNTLSRNIKGPFGAIIAHNYGTGFKSHAGVGLTLDVAALKNTFIQFYGVPVMWRFDGKVEKNTSIAGVFAETEISPHFKVGGYGEVNFSGSVGPEWGYGEVWVKGKVNEHISVSYMPAFTKKNDGQVKPKTEHRLSFEYTF